MRTTVLDPDETGLAEAAAALRSGQLVAFPTETVYGLAADASNPEAVAAVFRAKGRPADHPLIVHLADAGQLRQWTSAQCTTLRRAEALAQAFWPGPLTLVLPRSAAAGDVVTGGQETVAVRVPAHPVARRLLQLSGLALVAPSANRFGRISPTRAEHVLADLDGLIPFIVRGSSPQVGVESTIVDVSGPSVRVLRPGAIVPSQLQDVLAEPVSAGASAGSPRVSGSLSGHYAPAVPLKLVPAGSVQAAEPGQAVIATRPAPDRFSGLWRQLPAEPAGYARALYAVLHELDATMAGIVVEEPPADEAWAAVRDRLARASAGSGRHNSGT